MARVTINRVGIGEMLNMPEMEAMCLAKAEAVKEVAEATAPVYTERPPRREGGQPTPAPHPGRYKAGFSVRSGTHGGAKNDRAYAVVSNGTPEALAVEFGTEHNEAHHTLLAALSAAGSPHFVAHATNSPRGGS